MKIDIYSICWNEEDMLEFYFKNYERLAARYIFFDDGSSDRSLEILEANPKVEVRPFVRTAKDSYVLSALELQNNAWKESRGIADWVILTAVDEHLVHPDMCRYLARCLERGVTAIPALGYQMISEDFPAPSVTLSNTVVFGSPFAKMSKMCIFRPDAICETNYTVGRHSADPVGEVVVPARDEVLNLHYKYLDLERVCRRHEVLESGLGPEDRQRGWGHRYSFDRQQIADDWANFKSSAVDLRELGENAPEFHTERRWWREHSPRYPVVEV